MDLRFKTNRFRREGHKGRAEEKSVIVVSDRFVNSDLVVIANENSIGKNIVAIS